MEDENMWEDYDGKEGSLRTKFRDRVEKFEQYFGDADQHHKIFTELGFAYVDDGCDGFCPECERMLKCEVYPELREGWERFYQ
jgi:hypothetical protein